MQRRGESVLVAVVVMAGMCLMGWLGLRLLERFMRQVAQLMSESVSTVLNPMVEGETASSTGMFSQPVDGLTDPDLPWATGMSEEDLLEGKDPWSPNGLIRRPLEF